MMSILRYVFLSKEPDCFIHVQAEPEMEKAGILKKVILYVDASDLVLSQVSPPTDDNLGLILKRHR